MRCQRCFLIGTSLPMYKTKFQKHLLFVFKMLALLFLIFCPNLIESKSLSPIYADFQSGGS